MRGPQTPGELRGRSDRLHEFESIGEVEETLRWMATPPSPFARELARRPGQKETRWAHLLGGAIAEAPEPETAAPSEPLSVRVTRLEEQIAAVMNELHELKTKLGEE